MLSGIGRILKNTLVIVSFIYLIYLGYIKVVAPSPSGAEGITLGEAIAADQEKLNLDSTNSNISKDSIIENTNEKSSPISLAQFKELQDWDESHGYFSKEDYEMYESYGEETLKNLSSNGDIKAMEALANYYIQKDYRPDASVDQLRKAAVYGATTALTGLALNEQAKIVASGLDKTPEGLDEAMINVMTYYKVAAMRGDPRASIAQINAYAVVYKIRYGKELKPSKHQLEQIDAKAKEFYNSLQQERYALGLGDFDNSTHESIKKDYSIN